MGVLKTSEHTQIKIKILYPSQEPPASSKAQNVDLKDMDVLCTFIFKRESQNLYHGHIKDHWLYPNQDQDAKPQSRTPSVPKASNEDLDDMDDAFKIKIVSWNSKI